MTASDAIYVEKLQAKLAAAGVADDAEFLPNVSREEKIGFLESLTVFSVPATYSEAFGLYVIEALAAGVPVVLPKSSAFPEIIAATDGGRLFELGANDLESASALADALEALLTRPAEARALGERRAAERDQPQPFSRRPEPAGRPPPPQCRRINAVKDRYFCKTQGHRHYGGGQRVDLRPQPARRWSDPVRR